jgi:hypothetical protein
MAVVVSEFELVGEAPAEASGDNKGAAAVAPAPAPTPHEVEQIMRRREERAARLRAD